MNDRRPAVFQPERGMCASIGPDVTAKADYPNCHSRSPQLSAAFIQLIAILGILIYHL
jgi:hypothetical protein